MRFRLIFISLLLVLNYSIYADHSKKEDIQSLRQSIVLGDVNFTVTCKNPAAQQHFLLGAAFLHAFMYELALQQFQQAQRLDPGFAMSYWGEAMAYKHPIWNSEELAASQKALARYPSNKTNYSITKKERLFLKAAQQLFSNSTLYERDRAYMLAMEQFYSQYPDDPNVASFYALSLLGIASDFPNDKLSKQYIEQGRTLIDQLFQKYPNHPGVLHYYLHYHDNPDLKIAREAAPAGKIALKFMSSSSHVTHMAAHIYRRLELWDDYILANQISVKASDRLCKILKDKPLYACDRENKYHSLEWLHDGYLKKQHYEEANRLVRKMAKIASQDPGLEYKEWYYRMWARQVLTTKNWQMPIIDVQPIAKPDKNLYWSAYSECGALQAAGFLAAHQGKSVQSQLDRLNILIKYTNDLTGPFIRQTCQIAKLEIQTEALREQGNKKAAESYLKQALSQQKKQISTELTPSLAFLPADLYYQNYWQKVS